MTFTLVSFTISVVKLCIIVIRPLTYMVNNYQTQLTYVLSIFYPSKPNYVWGLVIYSHVGKYFHDRIIALIRFFFVNSISFQNTNINDRFVSSCSLFSFFFSSWLYLYIKNVLQREKISMCLCLSFSNTVTNNSHVNTQNAYKSKRTLHTLLCFIEAGLFTWFFFWLFSCFFFLFFFYLFFFLVLLSFVFCLGGIHVNISTII